MRLFKPIYKVVLLGEGRTGKTSLISRFVEDRFNEQEPSTVQAVMYCTKDVPIAPRAAGLSSTAKLSSSTNGNSNTLLSVRLSIWDTAGQERFHSLAPIYYRNADGAIIVYDLSDLDTLRKVRIWARELRAVNGCSAPLVICGNKSDLPNSEQEVSSEEAATVAAEFNAQHFFTSAKTGSNVAEVFVALATAIAAVSATPTLSSSSAAASATALGRDWALQGGNYDFRAARRKRRGLIVAGRGGEDTQQQQSATGRNAAHGAVVFDEEDLYDAAIIQPPRRPFILTEADMGTDDGAGPPPCVSRGGCC